MKTDKQIDDSYLSNIFKDVSIEEVSSGFTDKLMKRIEVATVREKKKNQRISILWIAVGIIGILLVPAIIFYFWPTPIIDQVSDISLPSIDFDFNPYVLTMGLSTLFLLVGDILLRRHHFHKSGKN